MASWYHMEDFKKQFSVGDIICWGNTGYPRVITAIGEERFLCRPLGKTGNELVKKVSSCGPNPPFRFYNPNAWPDCQYVYALERENTIEEVSSEVQVEVHLKVKEQGNG